MINLELSVDPSSTIITSVSSKIVWLTTESIAATGTISYTKEGGEAETYPVELSLIKENDSWLLNSYKETR